MLASNEGRTGTILEHTENADLTWVQQPGGETGSGGGSEVIEFANSSFGWRQQFADGSNASFVLQRTTDGGSTWTIVHRAHFALNGCEFLPDVFATTSIGLVESQRVVYEPLC